MVHYLPPYPPSVSLACAVVMTFQEVGGVGWVGSTLDETIESKGGTEPGESVTTYIVPLSM